MVIIGRQNSGIRVAEYLKIRVACYSKAKPSVENKHSAEVPSSRP